MYFNHFFLDHTQKKITLVKYENNFLAYKKNRKKFSTSKKATTRKARIKAIFLKMAAYFVKKKQKATIFSHEKCVFLHRSNCQKTEPCHHKKKSANAEFNKRNLLIEKQNRYACYKKGYKPYIPKYRFLVPAITHEIHAKMIGGWKIKRNSFIGPYHN